MTKMPKIPPHAIKVFEGVLFDIYQWQQEMFDGSKETFEAARRRDAVCIIPIIDDKVVIIHEEQPARGKTIGFPEGSIEPGETPLEAAKRELYEETGLSFADLKLVRIEDIGGPKVDWNCYRFVATGLINRDEPHLGPGEKVEVELVDFEKAKELSHENIYMSYLVMRDVETLEDLLNLPMVEASANQM